MNCIVQPKTWTKVTLVIQVIKYSLGNIAFRGVDRNLGERKGARGRGGERKGEQPVKGKALEKSSKKSGISRYLCPRLFC